MVHVLEVKYLRARDTISGVLQRYHGEIRLGDRNDRVVVVARSIENCSVYLRYRTKVSSFSSIDP